MKKERLCCALLICVLTAMTDETIQMFVPGRASMVTDVWIDTLGAVIGICVCAVLVLLRKTGNKI